MAFVPKVLLFGSISAALRYNCFSRCVAILINRRLGIPAVSYFYDSVSYIHTEPAQDALDTSPAFLANRDSARNDRKSDLRAELEFLGLAG